MKSSKDKVTNNARIFMDAAFGASVGYFLLMLIYMIFFLGIQGRLIAFLFKNKSFFILIDSAGIVKLLLLILGVLPLIVFLILLTLRIRYGTYRNIMTNNRGITFRGLIKKAFIPWNKVASVNIHDSWLLRLGVTVGKIKMIEVSSNNNKYYFPLSMKEKGQEYPSLYRLFSLIDKNYNSIRDIPPEECPLYVEIQKHLKQKDM